MDVIVEDGKVTIADTYKSCLTKLRTGTSMRINTQTAVIELILKCADTIGANAEQEAYINFMNDQKLPVLNIILMLESTDSLGYIRLHDALAKIASDYIMSTSLEDLRVAFNATNDFSPDEIKEIDQMIKYIRK